MKIIRTEWLRSVLIALTIAFGLAVLGDNPCIETGPHYSSWNCLQPGTLETPGQLSYTNATVYTGVAVAPPVLTSVPMFSNGQEYRSVTFDCSPNLDSNQIASVYYTPGSLYFVPPIPTVFTNPGTYTYRAELNGSPSPLDGWWPGEGNANDIVFGDNGTFTNAAYDYGMVGRAFSFNGSNNWVEIPNSGNISPAGTFTVEGWINFDRFTTPNSLVYPGMSIVAKAPDQVNSALDWALMVGTNGNLWAYVTLNGGLYQLSCHTAMQPGNWYHVAMVYDGNTLYGYVNGQVDGSLNIGGGQVAVTSNPLKIGAFEPRSIFQCYFSGLIDEVSLSSCAFSSNEIQAIYDAGSNGKCWGTSTNGCDTLPVGCVCSSVDGLTNGTVTITVVGSPPVITSQPMNQTVAQGGNAAFSVAATGTAPLGYQWQFNGGNISGATGSGYSISSVQPANAGNYDIVVSNSYGSVTSAVATLTVDLPVTITQQPQPTSQTVVQGANATFTLDATGTQPLGYQWYLNGTSALPWSNSNGYTELVVVPSDAGNYNAVVSNMFNSVTSSNATLNVIVPPIMTGEPTNLTVNLTSNATFSVTVSSSSTTPLSYQWLWNGTPVANATNSSLTISGVEATNVGYYSVIVTNAAGTNTSTEGALTVTMMNPAFTNNLALRVNGNSTFTNTAQDGRVLEMTPSLGDQAGSAFLLTPLNLVSNASFSTFFSFRLSKSGGDTNYEGQDLSDGHAGADGIVFCVQTLTNNIGSDGGGIGYLGITNSLGVVFDTWYNAGDPTWDPQLTNSQVILIRTNANGTTGDGNHVGVVYNGYLTNAATFSYGIMSTGLNAVAEHVMDDMNNSNIWYAWIDYNGASSNLEIRLSETNSRPVTPTLTNTVNLVNFIGKTNAYIGFTGGTGGSYNQEDILAWQFISPYHPIGVTNTPPSVAIVSPTNNSVFIYGPPIALQADASEQGGVITNVEFFAGTNLTVTNLLGTAVVGANGTYDLAWTNAVHGTNTLVAAAWDNNGNSSTSAVASVIMDSPPTVSAGPNQTLVWPNTNVTLQGSVSDDGLPYGITNVSWSVISSNGTVTLGSPNSSVTTAVFATNGVYVLQLTGDDGFATNSSTCTIWVQHRPSITITSPAIGAVLPYGQPIAITAAGYDLDGVVTNVEFFDGTTLLGTIPGESSYYRVVWTNAPDGVANLTAVATGSDGLSVTSAVVTITVNEAPVVYAGPNQIITLPVNSANLAGVVNDDGMPPGAAVTWIWSVISSNGPVTFGNVNQTNTTASFVTNGVYLLQLTANDTVSTNSSTVTITVNERPQVSVGTGQIVNLVSNSLTLPLNGSFSDDGLPVGAPVTPIWSVASESGPGGTVAIANANATTSATFTNDGAYVLQLAVNDTVSTNICYVTNIINRPPVVSAGTNQTLLWIEGDTSISTTLAGVATDDGLPYGTLTTTWTLVSGPGTVTFSPNSSTTNATAVFSTNGIYILQLKASDGFASSSNECVIDVERHPLVWIISPMNNATFNLGTSITNLAAAYGLYSYIDEVQFFDNGNLIGTATNPVSGLLAYYPFFGNTADVSGDGLNAQDDGATLVADRFGTANAAYSYNGSDYMAISDPNSLLNFDVRSNSYTVALWAKLYMLGQDQTFIIDRGTLNNPATSYDIYYGGTSNTFQISFWDGQYGSPVPVVQSAVSPVTNLWYHVAVVCSNGTVTLYVDGQPQSAPPISPTSPNYIPAGFGSTRNNDKLRDLGRFAGSDYASYLDGAMADVRIYGRALSSNEINQIYNEFSYDWTNAPAGSNILVAVATDSGGLQSTSAPVNFTVLNEIPTVQIISPVNQTLLAWTNTVITATNTSAAGGLPINWVEFFDNGTNIGYAGSTDTIYQLDWIPSAPGTNVLTALAVNTNGPSSWSPPVTNFVRTLPTIVITNPVYGQIFSNPPVNISIDATAQAVQDEGATVSQVIFYSGTNVIGTVTSAPYDLAWDGITNGTYSLHAEVIDSRGACGFTSNIVITVEPHDQPPSVYPGPNETIFFTTNVVPLNGLVSYFGLGSLSINWSEVSGPGSVTFTNSNLPRTGVLLPESGTYVLKLSASDYEYTTSSNVTITMLVSNGPPIVYPGTNQTLILPAFGPTNPVPTVVGVSNIFYDIPNYGIGIDYFPASNCLIQTFNSQMPGLELVANDDSTNAFSNVGFFQDEIHIVTVKDTMGGFNVGEAFCGNGSDGSIMRIEPDGTVIGTNAWVDSTGATNYTAWVDITNQIVIPGGVGRLRGGLWVDDTGLWGGDLLVSTTMGYVFRINSAGKVTLIAHLTGGSTYEGITSIPNNTQLYGPWAGRILLGDDWPASGGNSGFWAINTNGTSVTYSFPFGANCIRVIPPNENFFGSDYHMEWNGALQLKCDLYGIQASEFQGMVGDILAADENPQPGGVGGFLYRIHWNGSTFEIYPITQNRQNWEQFSFAPVQAANNVLPVDTVQLQGAVSDDGELFSPTSNHWTMVSGPYQAQFANPFLTNTIVNLAEPGDYVLQLSAYDGEYTVSSNVTIHVIRNQAPVVVAGTNQFIETANTTLGGTVTDDGWPNNQLTISWSQVSSSSGGTATFDWTNEIENSDDVNVSDTVSFSTPGVYVLALSASDGQATTTSNVTITVETPTFQVSAPVGTPTNQLFTFTTRLMDSNDNPITNAEVDIQVNGQNASSYSPPPSWFTNTTDTGGYASFTYAYSNFSAGIGPDVITIETTNYPDATATITNEWGQGIGCGVAFMDQQISRCYSVEPWLDGLHYADYYSFYANAGDTINLGLVNEETYPYMGYQNDNPEVMFLRNSSGVVAVSEPTESLNTSESGSAASQSDTSLSYTFSTSGQYVIEVAALFPLSSYFGPYDLYFDCGNGTVSPNMEIFHNGTNVPSGSTIVFPTINAGSGTNISLTITNAGSQPFEIVGLGTNTTFVLTNNILGRTIPPDGSTNVGIVFNPATQESMLGSLVLNANYPGGTNFVVYFMASTTPTNVPPSIQIVSPANGSTFLAANNFEIPFTAVATPGSANIEPIDGYGLYGSTPVKLFTDVTNGLFFVEYMHHEDPSWLVWTNYIQPWSQWYSLNTETDVTLTAVVTDVNGVTNIAPPVLLHLYPEYSSDPNYEPQLTLLYNGTNIPAGGTVVFPQTTPAVPVTVTLAITNTGNYPLGITGVGLAGDFTFTNNLQWQTYPPGASTNIDITYNASSSGSSGVLILSNNATPGGTFVVNLVGSAPAQGYVPPSTNLPVATNEQFTVLANSVNNVLYPLYLDQQFDTNTLTIVSIDTSQTTGTASIINNGTAISYTPQPGYRSPEIDGVWYPEDGLYYTVSDANGNTATGTISIVVYASDSPLLALGAQYYSPNAGALDVLTATNTTGSSNIVDVTFYLNNTIMGVVSNADANGNYDLNWTAVDFEGYSDTIQAAATDKFGQVGTSQPIVINVTPPPGAKPPVAAFETYEGLNDTFGMQALTNNLAIRDGVFNVYGQAYHPQGSNIVWQLSVYSADGTTLIRNLTPTNTVPVGSATSSNLLATCDLSTLQNGPYQLVLTVTGGYNETNASVLFFLDSTLKLGQFSFSQQDVTVPVEGIPLTVTRTYNSINPVKGDFGYGWTYTLANLNVSLDETRKTVTDIDGDTFTEHYAGSYDVTLTLPNGQVTTFNYNLSGPDSLGNYTPVWEPAPGVTAKLTLQPLYSDIQLQTILGSFTGGSIPPMWNVDPDTPWGNFDFPGFLLTTEDGTRYYIDRQDLGEHEMLNGGPDGSDIQAYGDCYLSHIVERNGDVITINPNSIVYTATNGATKQIAITRNSDNLISSISDPNSQSSSGPPSMVYQYDDQENLIAVEQLVNSATGAYVTNTFSYTNANFPHYITGIINANGAPVAENFYDDSGKLIAVRDAEGNLTQFFNNLTNNFQIVIDRMGNTNSYVYDSQGNIIVQTNALGDVTTMSYDVNNNKTNEVTYVNGAPYSTNSYFYDTTLNVILSSTDPLGHTTTYAYNTYGQLTNTVDPLGHSTTNYYDGNGNLVASSDALGDMTENIYVGDLMIASIDPIGTMTTNTYDQYENVVASATVDTYGTLLSSNTYTYDDNGNQLTSTVWRQVNGSWEGDTTTNVYDAINRVIQTINPDGGTNSTSYNATGLQAATIDANGNTTSYAYDNENHLVLTVYADGTTTSNSYDGDGNRVTATDQEGRTTEYQYNALNRLTNTIYPDGTTRVTVYDSLGRLAQTIDERGTITANAYDAAGRQIAVTNALGTAVQAISYDGYDADGNQTTATDADGHTTTNVYDALDRQIQVEYPNGTASEIVYDANGRKVATTNQDGIVTLFGYDGAGRLTSVTNASGQVTQYQYDGAGNEIAQIDALLRTNTYAYDGMGRKISHTLPAPSANNWIYTEGWAYDLDGNLIAYTNMDYDVLYSDYDEMNRVTNYFDWYQEFSYDYTYTLTGRRSSFAESYDYYSGINLDYYYSYDSRDRLTKKVANWNNNITETLSYGYDANGNVTGIGSQFANGVNLAYAYDPLGRLTNVLTRGQMAAAYSYDPAGNLTGMQYGNGVTNQYQYDSLNRLTNLVYNYGSQSRASFAYQLMRGGTRTNLVESINYPGSPISESFQWSYDNLYRMTNESSSSFGSVAYAYDSVGNRTNRFSGGSQMPSLLPSDSYSYDTNDQLVADGNSTPVNYDEMNDMQNWGTTNSWGYDDLGHLIEGWHNGPGWAYFYDGDNQRIAQFGPNTNVFYVVDDQNPSGYPQVLEEMIQDQSAGELTRVYNYGLGLISQEQFDLNSHFPTTVSYYGCDGHGSVRFLMNTNGAISDTYTYDAHGTLLSQNGTTPNNYLYSGQQWDPVLGLYYNRARYVDTDIGRFTSMDTYGGNNEDPLSLHKYLYAEDDPADVFDPLGFAGESDSTLFGKAVEKVIRKDFYEEEPRYRGYKERSIGYLVGKPAIGDLDQYPDLYNKQAGNNYIFEIKPITKFKLGKDTVFKRYLPVLQRYDATWRSGTALDYIYWDSQNGPIINAGVDGQPLPTGLNALVLPPIYGVITYLPIPPGFPKVFSDLIYNDVLADSQLEAEAATSASEAAAITPEAMGIQQLTQTAIELGRVGQLTMYVGEAGVSGVEATAAVDTLDSMEGAP